MSTPGWNNWSVPFSMIRFFGETVLEGSKKVRQWSRSKDILYHVTLTNGGVLDIALVNEYILGLAAMHAILAEFPTASCIVTGGSWNSCTGGATEYGAENNIGVFNVSEFASALTKGELARFAQEHEHGDISDPASNN